MRAIRVLIVDDNNDFAKAAGGFLDAIPAVEVIGYAGSGMEALAMITQLRPTLVLMDLLMPGMDGLEATRQIKCCAVAPKVVIVSMLDPETYDTAAHWAGADGFVSKKTFAAQLQPLLEALFHTGEGLNIAH